MDIFAIIAAVLAVLSGGLLRSFQPQKKVGASAVGVLEVFGAIAALYGIAAVIRYWDAVTRNIDSLFYAGALFLTMVFGMFVQVIAANRHNSSQRPFQVPLEFFSTFLKKVSPEGAIFSSSWVYISERQIIKRAEREWA